MICNEEKLLSYDGKEVKIICNSGFQLQGKCSLVTDEETDEDCLRFRVLYGIEEIPISDIKKASNFYKGNTNQIPQSRAKSLLFFMQERRNVVPKKLNDKQVSELIIEHANGTSISALAKKYKITRNTVKRYIDNGADFEQNLTTIKNRDSY